MKRILVISPHADDSELWAGASIARWAREGHRVEVLAITTSNGRQAEFREASTHTGAVWIQMAYPFVDRLLYENRKKLLEELDLLAWPATRPDLVLCPSSHDMHQDHRTVYEEVFRAFRGTSTLGFDVPYNSHLHKHNYYVSVTEEDLERKIRACACYKSEARKRYMQPEQIRAIAMLRGAEARVPFAEAFEVIRWIC